MLHVLSVRRTVAQHSRTRISVIGRRNENCANVLRCPTTYRTLYWPTVCL